MDSTVITAYLSAADTVHDGPLYDPLVRLAARVRDRLGAGPLLDLGARPDDPATSAHVAQAIGQTAALDPGFAADLDRLQSELDSAGGRARLGGYRPLQPGGYAARPVVDGYPLLQGAATYVRRAPGWAKACFVGGIVIGLIGFVTFGVTMFQGVAAPDLDSPGFPPGTIAGFAIFFVGAVIAGVGQYGLILARRR